METLKDNKKNKTIKKKKINKKNLKKKEENQKENFTHEKKEKNFLGDVFLEKIIIKDFSKFHSFLMEQKNNSTLTRKDIIPIKNLEFELPLSKKEKREQTNIEYLPKKFQNKDIYNPNKNNFVHQLEKKDFGKLYSPEDKLKQDQKAIYSSVVELSSEIEFKRKNEREIYMDVKMISVEELGKENKKTVEDLFEKIKKDYR